SLRAANHAEKLKIVEQNFIPAATEQDLLDQFAGKQIKIMRWNEYQDRKEIVEATLLSRNGQNIYKIGNEIYLDYPGTRILPKIPEKAVFAPQLTYRLENQADAAQDLELSYLASQMSWKADYSFSYREAEQEADVSGWATVDNQSGVDFPDASLKL